VNEWPIVKVTLLLERKRLVQVFILKLTISRSPPPLRAEFPLSSAARASRAIASLGDSRDGNSGALDTRATEKRRETGGNSRKDGATLRFMATTKSISQEAAPASLPIWRCEFST